MHRFQRILVFVDVAVGKSNALQRAIKLARLSGAHLTVVDVVQELPAFVADLLGDMEAAYQSQHADRQRALKGWLRGEAIEATTKVLHGRTAFALVREVLQEGRDLLIKDAHVEEGTVMLFGGVDLRLLRNCPCPVWLVKPSHERPFRRVLAAIDPQPSVAGKMLNARIMELASSICRIEGGDLQVVSVWRKNSEIGEFEDLQPSILQLEKLIETAARNTLNAVLATSAAPSPDCIHFEQGSPGSVISSVAAKVNADLVVMGTVARSGIPGLLIGNTAERVLRNVNCSVLTVKPDDFVSPIRLEDHNLETERLPTWKPA